jgi:hypothetical protein
VANNEKIRITLPRQMVHTLDKNRGDTPRSMYSECCRRTARNAAEDVKSDRFKRNSYGYREEWKAIIIGVETRL